MGYKRNYFKKILIFRMFTLKNKYQMLKEITILQPNLDRVPTLAPPSQISGTANVKVTVSMNLNRPKNKIFKIEENTLSLSKLLFLDSQKKPLISKERGYFIS